MFKASVVALTLASLAAAAPVESSSSAPAYISTYISSSWVSRFANATYTANATVTTTTTLTVTVTPGASTTSSSSSKAAASSSSSAVPSSSKSKWHSSSASASKSSAAATSSSAAPKASSSSAVAYEAVAVKSSSSSAAAAKSSAAPAASSAAASTSNKGQFSGQATYYTQDGNAGSCGAWHSDNDYIVAVNSAQQGGSCGKSIVITNTKNGKTVTAVAADTCPTCGWGDLDLSTGLFGALGNGDFGQGVFPISWSWA